MVRVGDPNLTAVVRRRRVRALGRFNRAKQARLPARGDSDDGQRSLLRVGHVDVPEDRVVSDQVRALSNFEGTKDPSVMGHVDHRDASSAGADEKPRFGFVQRETARRTFGAVLPLRHDSARGDIDRYGDLLVLAVRVDPRPDQIHRKRLRPSPAGHLHVGGVGESHVAVGRKRQDFDLALFGVLLGHPNLVGGGNVSQNVRLHFEGRGSDDLVQLGVDHVHRRVGAVNREHVALASVRGGGPALPDGA